MSFHSTMRKVELMAFLMNYNSKVVARLIQQKYKIYMIRIKNEFIYNWSFMILVASNKIMYKFSGKPPLTDSEKYRNISSINSFNILNCIMDRTGDEEYMYARFDKPTPPRNIFQTHCSRSNIGWFQLRSILKFLEES